MLENEKFEGVSLAEGAGEKTDRCSRRKGRAVTEGEGGRSFISFARNMNFGVWKKMY